ncbi:hypothetical protein [Campylobacter sp. RM16187]|uniref:hypothetical protein n=1 Tax=Campylobacter sp. RM16187 TaxID=1660063 RepID=UPI0021B656EC|nr:hypothetical protein [Campylobacter sp. RM16187]QKG29179.1 hypothetical protein CDOMF_0915 [Campylobacter sp. RM16187]
MKIEISNMELFDLYIGKIFALLIDSFPLKKNFYLYEITGDKTEFDEPINSCEKIALASVEWLCENEYIKVGGYGGDKSVHNAILTAKGLILLKQTPPSLKNDENLMSRLEKAVSISSEEAIKSVTNSILSLAVGALK